LENRLPTFIGAKLANHKLPVIAIVGDGDCYGEGGNHFIHACRGNHDITVIVHDNGVYGLTTGQVAPTAQKGFKSKSTPSGIIEIPINPLTLALTQGASFVAQSFAGNVNQVVEMIKAGMKHQGFSLINILQPCVTFNKINTYQYYLKQSYKLSAEYKTDNFEEALKISTEMTTKEKFPLGILYQRERPTYTNELPQVSTMTLVEKQRFINFEELQSDFI